MVQTYLITLKVTTTVMFAMTYFMISKVMVNFMVISSLRPVKVKVILEVAVTFLMT